MNDGWVVEDAVFYQIYATTRLKDTLRKEIQEKIRLSRLEDEIKQLLEKVSNANDVLMKYINEKIVLLDTKKNELKKEIYKISSNVQESSMRVIKNHLDK
ncbi:MAG: hypothetical protein K0S61_1041 [Anaerocolumna sp.]|jgi:hypothetical protein|nr:hypothetical protein [Anaerocolumna sp.]